MKFHLTAIFVNTILVFGIMHSYSFFVELLDSGFFVKKGQYFDAYFAYAMLVFSWLATFIIYRNKKYRTHYRYFISINTIMLLAIIIVKYLRFINNSTAQFEVLNLLTCIKYAILETMIPLVVISISINFFQNNIGKKLLPKMYEEY